MTSNICNAVIDLFWGGAAIAFIFAVHDGLVHIGNGLMARANVEEKRRKESKPLPVIRLSDVEDRR